ncbi:transposable element Tcb1 transposase [Trichonephila clavipes]|nr:transposable element Tcb1 transposase [Trichonephila clavipes]
MDVSKCIVHSRHGGALNSRRAVSLLVRLVEGEERWEAPDHSQGVLPLNWGETELNRSVTCMILKAMANDGRHLVLAMMNFVGLDLAFANQDLFLLFTFCFVFFELLPSTSLLDRSGCNDHFFSRSLATPSGFPVFFASCAARPYPWEIGSRVGRNQTTVMRICDRWMQDGTTDRRGRSHPPQCTTLHEDTQIVHMEVTDRSVTSRTVAQHIESVTHHSVSARTIRRHLHQSGLSARHALLGLPLTQNHRRLRRQWCDERRCGRQNGMKLSLLTSHTSVCNTTMVGFESGDTVERGC